MAVDLTSDALVTLSDVKDELGISVSTYDDTIKRMINAMSRRIRTYCGRILYFDEDIVEKVAGYGDSLLRLSRKPIVSVTSVTYDDAEVSSDDYTIRNSQGMLYRSTGWAWTAQLMSNSVADPLPGTEQQSFEVTYDAGWVTQPQVDGDGSLTKTLPEDLEDACLLAVVTRYRGQGQDMRIKSEKSLEYSVIYAGNGELLTPAVKEMLGPYRNPVLL